VTRHLSIEWPDWTPFRDRDGAPIRLLCVSDMLDPTIIDQRNRLALGAIDLILGCGDLDCDDLAFVADGFNAPLVYVYGNHDSPERWKACKQFCPDPIATAAVQRHSGVSIAGFTWPGTRGKGARRSERAAWSQVLRLSTRRLGKVDPMIVMTHVPPLGVGDVATDPYHRGFKGYRWLLDRMEPPLWIHGHTPMAAVTDWYRMSGRTMVVNVTGSVIIELTAPAPGTKPDRRRRTAGRGVPPPGQPERRGKP